MAAGSLVVIVACHVQPASLQGCPLADKADGRGKAYIRVAKTNMVHVQL
jgi:hypothetical protein